MPDQTMKLKGPDQTRSAAGRLTGRNGSDTSISSQRGAIEDPARTATIVVAPRASARSMAKAERGRTTMRGPSVYSNASVA